MSDTWKPTAEYGHAKSDLHAAAWSGDVRELQALVEEGVDVNWRERHWRKAQ